MNDELRLKLMDSTVFQFLLSVFVWVAGFFVMGVGFLVTLLLLTIGIPYKRVHHITAAIFGEVVDLTLSEVHISYDDDFNPDEPSVFCPNHVAVIDGHMAAKVIPSPFSGVMMWWHFNVPIYGWLMSMSGGVPVDPRKGRAHLVRKMSEAAKDRKKLGMSLLAFPEGARSWHGNLLPFKLGVFEMSVNADMPIVPVAFRGLWNVNNISWGQFWFKPFKIVEVEVGPQMRIEEGETVEDFALRVRQWIKERI